LIADVSIIQKPAKLFLELAKAPSLRRRNLRRAFRTTRDI